jgi:type II secretory pathway component PulK
MRRRRASVAGVRVVAVGAVWGIVVVMTATLALRDGFGHRPLEQTSGSRRA